MDTARPHPPPQRPALIDRFGRRISYLRLSVTDRCDLRCTYCIPKGFKDFEEPSHWLSFAEIERVVAAFARMGVSRVRLTGGEPLLRRGLPELAQRLSILPGLDDLSLSSNATQLAQHAQALKAAGVNRLNISLDSLRPERWPDLTGRAALPQVLAGLAAARAAGFTRTKLNMVVQAGVNDDEIEDVLNYCRENGFILRLIETMPMGDSGRRAQHASLQPILAALAQRHDLHPAALELGGGPARYWQSRDGEFTVGVITPISQHFCASCNRVRLSVDGTLYLCLGQDEKLQLRPLLRAGISDDELEVALRAAIELKPERHEFSEQASKIIRVMARTGG